MKRILILVAILIVMISPSEAQNLKYFFNSFQNDSRFESVTVGKFLLTLPLIFGNLNRDERDFLSSIKRIKILKSNFAYNSEFSRIVLNDLDKALSLGNYENILEARDKNQTVKIYYHILANKNSDLLLVANENDEMCIIWINGKISEKIMEKLHNQLADNSSNFINKIQFK